MTSRQKELLQRLNEKAGADLGVLFSRFGGELSQGDRDAIIRISTSFTHYLHTPALARFVEEPNVNNSMGVFWDIYQRRKGAGGSFPPDPSIDAETYEGMMLELLDYLYQTNKVSYQPDVDDSEKYERLLVHLHIAGGRALRIRNGPELSEEALDCFREVSRVYERIRQIPAWSRHIYESVTEPSVLISTLAVAAMSYLELSRFHRRDKGHYEKALGDLRLGIELYEDALWNSRLLDNSGETDSSFSEEETACQKRLKNLLTGLEVSLYEAAGLYYALRASPAEVSDWVEVARICEALSHLGTPEAVTGHHEVIEDPWSEIEPTYMTWDELWSYARGWSQERLSHSNYRDLCEYNESNAAESRLKTHFHGGASWASLAERARRHLVNADILFHSTQRVGTEAILNELLIAVEEMFSAYIWEPLSAAEWDPELDEFEERRKCLHMRDRNPSITDFVWVCRQPFFQKYLEGFDIDEQEIRFLTEYLPARMDALRNARNLAQHEVGHIAPREDIEWHFRGFIGIGQPGALPMFARVGQTLKSH